MALFIDSQKMVDDELKIVTIPEHRWYPVYCRPNKEKKLVEFAIEQNIPCYMPEYMRHRITRGRRVATPVPMFSGYVFVCTTRQQNWTLKRSQYVVRMLPVTESDESRLILELNIIRIFESLACRQPVEVHPEIIPGKHVIISRGKLQGIEGIVEKRKNKVEIIVRLDFLGCSLATLGADDLELA